MLEMNAFYTLMILASLGAGGGEPRDRALVSECRSILKSFFRLPIKERMTHFSLYEAHDQLRIFICGNQTLHPPAIYLSGAFAQQGEVAVPVLKEGLAEAQDDLTIRDILLVFREMQRRRTYDVAGDPDLVQLISSKAASVKDPDWRRVSTRYRDEIVGMH